MRVAAVGARNGAVQKTFWLAIGWTLVVVGIVLLPAPLPVPLIGMMPLLTGLAILTTHSKSMRRRQAAADIATLFGTIAPLTR